MAEERKVKRTEGDEIIDIMVENIITYLRQKVKADKAPQTVTLSPNKETFMISRCYPAFSKPLLTSQIDLQKYKAKIRTLFSKLIKELQTDKDLKGTSFEDIIEAILSMMPGKAPKDTPEIRSLIEGANGVFGHIEKLKIEGLNKLQQFLNIFLPLSLNLQGPNFFYTLLSITVLSKIANDYLDSSETKNWQEIPPEIRMAIITKIPKKQLPNFAYGNFGLRQNFIQIQNYLRPMIKDGCLTTYIDETIFSKISEDLEKIDPKQDQLYQLLQIICNNLIPEKLEKADEKEKYISDIVEFVFSQKQDIVPSYMIPMIQQFLINPQQFFSSKENVEFVFSQKQDIVPSHMIPAIQQFLTNPQQFFLSKEKEDYSNYSEIMLDIFKDKLLIRALIKFVCDFSEFYRDKMGISVDTFLIKLLEVDKEDLLKSCKRRREDEEEKKYRPADTDTLRKKIDEIYGTQSLHLEIKDEIVFSAQYIEQEEQEEQEEEQQEEQKEEQKEEEQKEEQKEEEQKEGQEEQEEQKEQKEQKEEEQKEEEQKKEERKEEQEKKQKKQKKDKKDKKDKNRKHHHKHCKHRKNKEQSPDSSDGSETPTGLTQDDIDAEKPQTPTADSIEGTDFGSPDGSGTPNSTIESSDSSDGSGEDRETNIDLKELQTRSITVEESTVEIREEVPMHKEPDAITPALTGQNSEQHQLEVSTQASDQFSDMSAKPNAPKSAKVTQEEEEQVTQEEEEQVTQGEEEQHSEKLTIAQKYILMATLQQQGKDIGDSVFHQK